MSKFTNKKTSTGNSILRWLFSALVILGVSSGVFAQTNVPFSYTGANQTWTCPAGVTTVTVTCWGAGGAGASTDGSGGAGAYMKGTLTVSPSTTYTVVVGGGGNITTNSTVSAFGGGGTGGNITTATIGGGGGGYTGVFNAAPAQGSALVIAGGGDDGIRGGVRFVEAVAGEFFQ